MRVFTSKIKYGESKRKEMEFLIIADSIQTAREKVNKYLRDHFFEKDNPVVADPVQEVASRKQMLVIF